jgi:hypothetical protein
MREDDNHLSLIDKWSDSMDEVWAQVLDEDSDDEIGKGAKPSEIDQTLDTALSRFDEEKIDGLGCLLDSIFLNFSLEEEEIVKETQRKIALNAAPKRNSRYIGLSPRPGLPPRPGKKKVPRSKPKKEEERQEDNGFFAFMYGSATAPNERRDEVQAPPHESKSATSVDCNAPVPLVRRISFKRVSSSPKRVHGNDLPPEEEGDDEVPRSKQERQEENAFFAFMYGRTVAPNEPHEEFQTPPDNTASSVNDAHVPVPLVRRISFKRVSSSLKRVHGRDLHPEDEGDDDEDEEEDFFGESQSPQDHSTDEAPKDETEGDGILTYIFGSREDTPGAVDNMKTSNRNRTKSAETSADKADAVDHGYLFSLFNSSRIDKSRNRNSLAKKFSRNGPNQNHRICSDRPVSAESFASVRLVKRDNVRRQRSGGKSGTLRSLQAERF